MTNADPGDEILAYFVCKCGAEICVPGPEPDPDPTWECRWCKRQDCFLPAEKIQIGALDT